MVTWACRLLVIAAASLAAATSLAEEQSFDKRFNAPPGGRSDLRDRCRIGGRRRARHAGSRDSRGDERL
jgi:hypothetical protein